MIPFGTSVWYPSMHPSKEKPRWSPAVCLGPAQSAHWHRLFQSLLSSRVLLKINVSSLRNEQFLPIERPTLRQHPAIVRDSMCGD